MGEVKIVIGDNDINFKKQLIELLTDSWGMDVIFHTGDGLELKSFLQQNYADLVILDVQLSGLDGIDLTRWLSIEYPQTGVLAISSVQDWKVCSQLIKAGVKGIVFKQTSIEELRQAIKHIYRRSFFFSKDIEDLID
jgi:DNA-binding NarL/FixJ family response regulator